MRLLLCLFVILVGCCRSGVEPPVVYNDVQVVESTQPRVYSCYDIPELYRQGLVILDR